MKDDRDEDHRSKQGAKGGVQMRQVQPAKVRYDFSDLKDVAQSDAAFRYLDKGWRIVPLNSFGEPVAIDEAEEPATVPSWVEDPKVRVGIATGRKSGIVALWFPTKLLRRRRRTLANHPHPPTLENNGLDGYYFIFRAPKEDLPCLQIDDGAYILGEGGAILPAHHRWGTACAELAPLPDSLRRLALGEPPLSIKEKIAAGGLAAANKATAHEAAQAYVELGWKLVPVDGYSASPLGEPGASYSPEFWEKSPSSTLGVQSGIASGVVGLICLDHKVLGALRAKHNLLSAPLIDGKHPILCFQAPKEGFPTKELSDQLFYIGEEDRFPVPPSRIDGRKLVWESAEGPFQGLPELPESLRKVLAQESAATTPKPARDVAKRGDSRTSLLHSALTYAAKGIQIFPLKPNTAEPMFPKKGASEATTDPKTITRWWKWDPNANIGVPTGGAFGTVVLVADAQSGVQALAELEKQHGRLETSRAENSSGTIHLYFDGPEVGAESTTILPGLEFRGSGSFDALPPSCVNGRQYLWIAGTPGKAKVPDWLLDIVAQRVREGRATGPTTPPALAVRLDAWLAERCEMDMGFSAKAAALRQDFSEWSGSEVTPQLFGRLLTERGFERGKSSGILYRGLRLRRSASRSD